MDAVADAAAAQAAPTATRRIWLCADDYGISPAVSGAIRDLVTRGRINATSAMMVAPSLKLAEARSLAMLNTGTRRVAIGLHLTLTGPFRPLTDFKPVRGGAFPPLNAMIARALLRRLDAASLLAETKAQLAAFVSAFGAPPAFVDGHQHVHLLPQVRDAVLAAVKQAAPAAWVRQCGSATPWLQGLRSDRKALFLDRLSRGFRAAAKAHGVAVNPGFAGTYAFGASPAFEVLFPGFLDGMPDGGVVMCHPGVVDAELERLDPLTDLREREYAYFLGPIFPKLLASRGISLA
jgi:predicted glycoside hydrolase/deacetylase ChbG (UPF0249 family)